MSVAQLHHIVEQTIPTLFAKIDGGQIPCASDDRTGSEQCFSASFARVRPR